MRSARPGSRPARPARLYLPPPPLPRSSSLPHSLQLLTAAGASEFAERFSSWLPSESLRDSLAR